MAGLCPNDTSDFQRRRTWPGRPFFGDELFQRKSCRFFMGKPKENHGKMVTFYEELMILMDWFQGKFTGNPGFLTMKGGGSASNFLSNPMWCLTWTEGVQAVDPGPSLKIPMSTDWRSQINVRGGLAQTWPGSWLNRELSPQKWRILYNWSPPLTETTGICKNVPVKAMGTARKNTSKARIL